jgi:hypothetical protein
MNPHSIPEWLNYSGVESVASQESIAACDGSTITMVPIIQIKLAISIYVIILILSNQPAAFQLMEKKHTKRSTSSEDPQYVVPKEGVYLFIITIRPKSLPGGNHTYKAQILIDMKSDVGYLSVIDWPLLPVNIFLFE